MITRHTTNTVLDTPSRLFSHTLHFFARIPCLSTVRLHLSKSSLSDAYRSIPLSEALTQTRNAAPKHALFRSSKRPLTNHSVIAQGQTRPRLTTFPFPSLTNPLHGKREEVVPTAECHAKHPPPSPSARYGDSRKTPSRGLRPDRSIAPGWPLHSAESAQQTSVMVHG